MILRLTCIIVSCVLHPLNGIFPVSITNVKIPKLHISHNTEYLPWNTYGAAYYGVPHTLYVYCYTNKVPNPQSINFIFIFYLSFIFFINIFYGFISLWAMPKLWV